MIELDPEKYKPENLLTKEEVSALVDKLKKEGKKVGLCTGSWDLLHPGHIAHFDAAKEHCDILIVGVARDHFSSGKHPGSKRPIYSHDIRAYMISKLDSVDYVFFEDGLIEQVLIVKPDVYFKGDDYANLTHPNIVAQKKMMETVGGQMIFTNTEKLSTTDIIDHIKYEIDTDKKIEKNEILNLEEKAKELRRRVLDLGMETGEAHFGGSFSEIEILVSLYNKVMKEEDEFILSKGHACYPLYILLREKGCNPRISGHPDMCREHGLTCTTGSLGHGFPIGIGMALTRKLKNKSGRIYVLISDGECQEGTTWESAQIAAHHKLDNLVVIIDHNKLQALEKIDDVLSLRNLKNKFEAFGFQVSEINGHNFEEVILALKKEPIGKPHVIIAHTIKGKGISYMENDPKWHTRLPTPEELKQAHEELK